MNYKSKSWLGVALATSMLAGSAQANFLDVGTVHQTDDAGDKIFLCVDHSGSYEQMHSTNDSTRVHFATMPTGMRTDTGSYQTGGSDFPKGAMFVTSAVKNRGLSTGHSGLAQTYSFSLLAEAVKEVCEEWTVVKGREVCVTWGTAPVAINDKYGFAGQVKEATNADTSGGNAAALCSFGHTFKLVRNPNDTSAVLLPINFADQVKADDAQFVYACVNNGIHNVNADMWMQLAAAEKLSTDGGETSHGNVNVIPGDAVLTPFFPSASVSKDLNHANATPTAVRFVDEYGNPSVLSSATFLFGIHALLTGNAESIGFDPCTADETVKEVYVQ